MWSRPRNESSHGVIGIASPEHSRLSVTIVVPSLRSVAGIERAEVNAFVLELAQIQHSAGLDEWNGTPHVLRAVQADHSIDSAGVDVERQEAAGVKASAYDELVPLRVVTRVLQVRVVLVRPEPVDLIVRDSPAEHVARGSGALLDRVMPVLHADLPLEYGVIVIRDVAGRVNARDAGLAILVDDHPVVHLNASAVEDVHDGLDADPRHHEVALQAQTTFRDDPGHAVSTCERGDRVFENRPNAMRAMQVGDALPDRLAEDAEQRRFCGLDGDDIQAFLSQRCGDFRADESHPDDNDAATGTDFGFDAIGVFNRTKAINAFELATRNRDAPVAATRGDEQYVKRHAAPILELDKPRRGVDSGCADSRQGFDAMFGVERGRPHERLVKRHLTAEVAFRQQGSLVRRLPLGAD